MTRGNLRPVRRPRRRNLAGFPLVLTILAAALACATGPEPRPEGLPSGINDVFLAKDLDVDAFVERFEGESRAVYAQRHAIVEALELSEGDRVADIGAGTGFFSFLFAEAVGETGRVYAVEISPRFLDLLRERAALQRLDTPQVVEGTERSIERPVVEGTERSIERPVVEGTERSAGLQVVEGTERSVELPPDSVDLAFLQATGGKVTGALLQANGDIEFDNVQGYVAGNTLFVDGGGHINGVPWAPDLPD